MAAKFLSRSWKGSVKRDVIPQSPNAYSEFGSVVSLGDRLGQILASSGKASPNLTSSGRVHVYRHDNINGWTERPYLQAPNPASFDNFGKAIVPIGYSADESLNILAIGVPGAGDGKVFIFTQDALFFTPNSDWALKGELPLPAGQISDFGENIWLSVSCA